MATVVRRGPLTQSGSDATAGADPQARANSVSLPALLRGRKAVRRVGLVAKVKSAVSARMRSRRSMRSLEKDISATRMMVFNRARGQEDRGDPR